MGEAQLGQNERDGFQSGPSAIPSAVLAQGPDASTLVSVRHLAVSFGAALAVRDMSLQIRAGEVVGLVGESGSGKSVTALSLISLLNKAAARVNAEELRVVGCDILSAGTRELQRVRGGLVGMVFQDPLRSLHPMKRVDQQLTEGLRLHLGLSRLEASRRGIELLERVGIGDASRRVRDYPHQFSGGQRQRIMIAMAISCRPLLLIADEPTTALDVTVQAQILDLICELQAELRMGVLLITHDLSVIARVCNRVLVMYGGRLVEEAPSISLFDHPRHPYTSGLLSSVPRIDMPIFDIQPIPGLPIAATARPTGCPFRPRCRHSISRCSEQPPLEEVEPGHFSACWRSTDL
jgi:oligopeptide/dipeptide ABC transporter ATP-binding protein